MKTLVWVGKEEEPWSHHHHFAPLVEDLTGISLNETMCPNVVKYMAQRLMRHHIATDSEASTQSMKMNTKP